MPTVSCSSYDWPRRPIAPAGSTRRSRPICGCSRCGPITPSCTTISAWRCGWSASSKPRSSHHRLSLAADPDNPALHSNLGNALRAANRLDEAVKHHFHSITLNRDYAEGFFNLALCLRDLGRVDEAVGCFGRALALNPDNRRARSSSPSRS